MIDEASAAENIVLFIQDGSELLFNHHHSTTDLGKTSDAYGNGLMMHNCIAVHLDKDLQPDRLGLAHQEVWVRGEQKPEAEIESRVWLKTLQKIGPPPKRVQWITVGDRANAIHEFHREAV